MSGPNAPEPAAAAKGSERKSRPQTSRNKLTPLEVDVPGAVITVSTRCANGEREDKSGPVAVSELAKWRILSPDPMVVPGEVDVVRAAIAEAIAGGARFILTTGGTGVTREDVVPEACEALIAQRLWNIETQILLRGLENTPLAGLSRAMVGIVREDSERGVVLANAPGSRGGVKDTVAVVAPLFPNLLEQLDNPDL
ncbi:MAG: molybdopterin-binding protein [Actinomycetaceae bacterium]|nr:molybdopterin-binding protein [Actinomycetaceae bacterium]